MTLIRILFALVLVTLLPVSISAEETQVETDARLVEAEAVYRTEGPAVALPQFESLLSTFKEQGQIHNLALTQRFVGACHWRLGNYATAREFLDLSLANSLNNGNRLQTGKTQNLLGLVAWDEGNLEVAIEKFRLAGEIGREASDARLEGAALNNLSLVYDELGDYRTSLQQYQHVLEIYKEADFPRGMGDTLGNIGGVHLLLGHFTEAEHYYLQALAISEEMQSVAAMSQDHGNLGLAYTGKGQSELALQHFEKALQLAIEAGLTKEQGQWLRGKANAHIMAGHYDLGLKIHQAALQTLDSAGAKTQLLDALHDMGEMLLLLGDSLSAEEHFRRAMALAKEMNMPRLVTLNLLALGDLQFRHQNLHDASDLYEQALGRSTESGEKLAQSWSLLRIARLSRELGDFDAGMRASTRALEAAREMGAPAIEAEALLLQAEFDREAGTHDTALKKYEEANRLSEQVGDPDLLWQIAFGQALALEETGRIEAAIAALESAVGIIESVRSRLQEKRYRAGYLQNKEKVYVELVRLQMKLSRTSEAFSTAERLRTWSNTLQEVESGARLMTNKQRRVHIELRERIRQIQRNIEEESTRLPPERRQMAIDTFSSELLLAERELQALLDNVSGGTASSAPTKTLSSTELQHRLRHDESLIQYVVGTDQVTIFVMTTNELHALNVRAGRNNLHSRLDLLRNMLQQRDNDRWKAPAQSLSRTLFQPLVEAGWLTGSNHVYLVPHGVLNYLPFALLPVSEEAGGQLMIERFSLAYLPAAAFLNGSTETTTPNHSLLAMAPEVSGLVHAPEEVRSIGALYSPNAELMLGATATETSFKSIASQFGIVHLATHGYFNRFNPLLSGLQLEADDANDGLLEVHEILELELDSALVTLSACRTGLGSGYFATIPAGDDFVGMTRAFLQVGSASVLATLWEVEDQSTVGLMKLFYGHLETGQPKLNKAIALVQAQRAFLTSRDYEHPYYWAPFVLVGSAHRGRIGRT